MGSARIARPTILSIVMLVAVAALVTVVINLVEILVVVVRHEASGFVVVWSEMAWEFGVVFVVLLAVLLIGGVRRPLARLTLLLPIALFVVAVVAWSDCSVVSNRGELAAVGFGYPYNWLIQDQSALSPPLPHGLSAGSIHESPTSIAWGAFAIDLALAYVFLLGALLVARKVTAVRG
jgi:hypothetical protein